MSILHDFTMKYIAAIIISYGPMNQNMKILHYYNIISPHIWLQNDSMKLLQNKHDDSTY